MLAGPRPSGSAGLSRRCRGCLPPLAGVSRFRLPPASLCCCDSTTAQVFHLRSVAQRLVAHQVAFPMAWNSTTLDLGGTLALIITIGSTNRLVRSSGEQRRFRACPCATRSALIDLDTLHGLSRRVIPSPRSCRYSAPAWMPQPVRRQPGLPSPSIRGVPIDIEPTRDLSHAPDLIHQRKETDFQRRGRLRKRHGGRNLPKLGVLRPPLEPAKR